MSETEKARAELDQAYGRVRELLTDVHVRLAAIDRAGPEDDLEGLLKELEDSVQKARTGGAFGSGAKGHSRALRDWKQAMGGR
jgi:hypothetical protein